MSLLGDYHPPATRSRAMALHQSSVYAGTIGGGVCSGWLGEHSGWRPMFACFGLLGIAKVLGDPLASATVRGLIAAFRRELGGHGLPDLDAFLPASRVLHEPGPGGMECHRGSADRLRGGRAHRRCSGRLVFAAAAWRSRLDAVPLASLAECRSFLTRDIP